MPCPFFNKCPCRTLNHMTSAGPKLELCQDTSAFQFECLTFVLSYRSRHACSRHSGNRKRWRGGGWRCRGRWPWSCTSAGFYYCQRYLTGTEQSHFDLETAPGSLLPVTRRAETVPGGSRSSKSKSNFRKFGSIHHFVGRLISFIQMMDNWFWNKTL